MLRLREQRRQHFVDRRQRPALISTFDELLGPFARRPASQSDVAQNARVVVGALQYAPPVIEL